MATYHAIADLYPSRVTEEDLVQLTNDEVDGDTIVPAVWSTEAGRADALIDGYVGVRYALPLSAVPDLVAELSITVTLYNLYRRRFPQGVPEQVRQDYTDALAMLDRVSKGRIRLGVPELSAESARGAQVAKHTAVFSRDTLSDF